MGNRPMRTAGVEPTRGYPWCCVRRQPPSPARIITDVARVATTGVVARIDNAGYSARVSQSNGTVRSGPRSLWVRSR
jgi:hypothetical protein